MHKVRVVMGVAVLFSGGAMVGTISGGCSSDEAPKTGPGCVTLASGDCVTETFQNPPVLEADETGAYNLSLAATEVTIDGQRHCVRAYNGDYLAPTIETAARDGDPGRMVRVNLANKLLTHDYRSLEADDCTCRNAAGDECVPAHIHDPCTSASEGDACVCNNDDGEECEHMFDFNVTNLHAHGSHVRPDYARGGNACEPIVRDGVMYACRDCDADVCDGRIADDTCFHGDNVLNAVHPGGGAQYRWDIDEDGTHHTGLQWYHPHIHGTTAIQVASGAAGAWIVRGPLDELDGIRNARERVIVFTTPPIDEEGFSELPEGESCTDETITFNRFEVLGSTTAPQLNIINGERRPRMITPPGQVERWRILHAGFLDEVFLGLFRGSDESCTDFSTASEDTIQLTQIGRDGLIMPQTFEHDNIFMSPGYRVEAIIGGEGNLKHGETWCLVAARFLQPADESKGPFFSQPLSVSEPPSPDDIVAKFDSDGDVIAILNVSADAGTPTTTTLPDYSAVTAFAAELDLEGVDIDERCAQAAAITDPEEIDQAAVLQVGAATVDDPDPCDCTNYNVNCYNFEETDRTRRLFDRDMPLGAVEHWRIQASLDGHPFHIHINPYIVCPSDNAFDPIPFPHWRDTYLVNLDRKIDIITQNKSYTGPFVFHCHKLTHEDHGMMQLVRVCDPESDDTCGDYDWRACEPDDLFCQKALAATDCALGSQTDAETVACITELGSPTGICGPNACVIDDDCPVTDICDQGVCEPAPCMPACAPPSMCVHGACE